jgi:monoamine oxidase
MEEERSHRHADVIVIGAGMAGASAAHDLHRAGKSVLVLEASDRIGGRIWSDHHDGVTVDLGAGWIHFAEWNPVKGLAHGFGIEVEDFYLNSERSAFFGPRQERLSEETFADYTLGFASVMAGISECASQRQKEGLADISLGEAFETVMKGATPERQQTMKTLIGLAIEMPLGAEISQVSLFHFADDLNVGAKDYAVPRGYVTIVERLLEGIPIERKAPVTTIRQTDEGVTIHTHSDDAQGDRVFTCDYVIVTVSVGVLKNGSISFDPPLPAQKQTALCNLEMGHDDKYWFRFDDAFWTKLVKEPRQNLFRFPAVPDSVIWLDFMDFTKICKVPMLLAFQGGALTEELESLSDEEVIDRVMPALKWLFGDDAQRPVSVRRSRWVQDPWTRGAYSHLKPGGTPRDRVTLGEPAGRVRFAGEATMRYFPDSVHGAYLSGKREAARILTPDNVPDELDEVVVEDVSRELRWGSSPIRTTTSKSVRRRG